MKNSKNHNFSSQLYQDILNQLHLNVCVADMETDRLVYVNEHMKKDFPDEKLEGMTCWKVLEKEQEKKCSFCPQMTLSKGEEVEP